MSYRWPCITLLVSVLALQPLFAQPNKETLAKPFSEIIDINVVNVEVFVTDRDGKPVKGLGRDQFQIFEDGEPMPITHFFAAEGSPASGETIAVPEDQAPAPTTVGPVGEESFLVIYFDTIHLNPGSRKRVIQGLRSFLAEAGAWNGRVMIAAATGSSFEIFHPFGASLEHALAALDRIAEQPALGILGASDRRAAMGSLRDIWEAFDELRGPLVRIESPCKEGQKRMEAQIKMYSDAVYDRNSKTLGGLARLSSSLAALPGQKAVAFVSEGLEVYPGNDVFEYLYQLCPELTTSQLKETTLRDMSRRFADLTAHANANRVTFYTLDAAGLRSTSSMSIEGDDPRFIPSSVVDSARRANLENSLSFIAAETGGRTVFNTNEFAPIFAELGEDLTSFYSLGYQPPHAGDDRVHSIEVKVKGVKNLRVRHRRSYRDKPSEERMADRTLGALLHGLQENPLGAQMALGSIRATEKGNFSVPVQIQVPIKNLVLVPEADRQHGYLRLMLTVRDADGMIAPIRQKELGIALSPGQQTTGNLGVHSFVVEMEMRSGEHLVAVAIRDEMSGSTSYLASRLNVEAAL